MRRPRDRRDRRALLVADLVAVTTDPSPADDEVQRLQGELSRDPALRTWLAIVWPDALRALGGDGGEVF